MLLLQNEKKNSSIKVVFLLWIQILNKNDFDNGLSYLKPWTMFRPTKHKLYISALFFPLKVLLSMF